VGPEDPVGETRWLETVAEKYGLPRLWSVMPRPTATTSRRCSQAMRPRPFRGIRHFPRAAQKPAEAKRGLPGSMDDPRGDRRKTG